MPTLEQMLRKIEDEVYGTDPVDRRVRMLEEACVRLIDCCRLIELRRCEDAKMHLRCVEGLLHIRNETEGSI